MQKGNQRKDAWKFMSDVLFKSTLGAFLYKYNFYFKVHLFQVCPSVFITR